MLANGGSNRFARQFVWIRTALMLFDLFLSKFERGVTNGWRVASSAGLISSTVKIRFRFCGVACGIWFQVRQGFSLNLHEMNAQKF